MSGMPQRQHAPPSQEDRLLSHRCGRGRGLAARFGVAVALLRVVRAISGSESYAYLYRIGGGLLFRETQPVMTL